MQRSWRLNVSSKIVAVVLAFGVFLTGVPAMAASTNVVVYTGGTITKAEFQTFEGINRLFNPYYDQIVSMDTTYRKKIARQLVGLKVLTAKADKATLAKLSTRATSELNSFRSDARTQLGGQDAYKSMLNELKITESDIKTYFMRSAYVTDYFKKTYSAIDVTNQYNKMVKNNQFVIASVRHILVMTNDPSTGKAKRTDAEALKIAKQLKAKLDAGADFATLAKANTDDGGSKNTGGLYADADVNTWVAEFKTAAIKQPLNKIGDPVKTTYGYHIIRVEKRSNKKLADVRTTVEGQLFQDKFSTYIEKDLAKVIKSVVIPK
jgi:foldase protein PrsA